MTTPTYQNSSAPSPFHLAASSSSSSSHNFLYSTTHDQQDQSGYYHKELQQPLIIQQDQADNFASHGGGSYVIENESSDNGLKFSIWKKEDKYANHQEKNNYQVKWMSSKMRLMHKMKNVGRTAVNAPPTATSLLKLEDQKQQPSSPMETENSSNSSSNNSNSPIRVCSDCNTAKTPLWRSGPQGPKSLCNACGIRQRKARRAMAAAAAANGTTIQTETTPVLLKTTKTQQKDKRSSNTTGHVAKYKKRSTKLQPATNNNSSHQAIKKLCFEDFLVSLSKNLAFHRVFPQDEKEAAILLMALSCGRVHG